MASDFEQSRTNLSQLCGLFNELDGPEKINEAQTRLTLIDNLLFDCLGWSKADCQVEDRLDSTYADYVLAAPNPLLVVEAKRVGNSFALPAGTKSKSLVGIPTLRSVSIETFKAVEQAVGYALDRGLPFAAVANGFQLILCLGSRTDGVQPMKGKAFLFDSLEGMLANFNALWNLASKPAVSQHRLQVRIQQSPDGSPPQKLSSSIQSYPGLKRRNPLQAQLTTVASYLLEEALHQEGLERFIKECYCKTGALAEYATISKNILRSRYSKMFEQAAGGIQIESAGSPESGGVKGISTASSSRPLILLGNVGVGKSIFMQHLFEIEMQDHPGSAIVLVVDFLSLPTFGAEAIFPHVLQQVRDQLEEKYAIDIGADALLRSVYHNELRRFSRSPAGRLKGRDDAAYERARVAFLDRLLEDVGSHVKTALRYIQKGLGRQVVLVLDNIDHHVRPLQEEVFRVAVHASEVWGVSVFVAMRPATFYRSRKEGTISAYQPRAFSIDPPLISQVISKRFTYVESLMADGKDPTLLQICNDIPSLQRYLDIVSTSLRTNPELYESLENLCGCNVRHAIELVQYFLGSGHVDTADVLNHDTYTIPLHQFLRAVIYRDHIHFDPNDSTVINVYDISSHDGKEHFLSLLVLSLLDNHARHESGEGFQHRSLIHQSLQQNGFSPAQIEFALARLLAGGLLDDERGGVDLASAGEETATSTSLRINATGGYYLRRLSQMFTYIDAVVVDTPVADVQARNQLQDAPDIDNRLCRAELFIGYLDSQWVALEHLDVALDWRGHSRALMENVRLVRSKSRRDRKHQF